MGLPDMRKGTWRRGMSKSRCQECWKEPLPPFYTRRCSRERSSNLPTVERLPDKMIWLISWNGPSNILGNGPTERENYQIKRAPQECIHKEHNACLMDSQMSQLFSAGNKRRGQVAMIGMASNWTRQERSETKPFLQHRWKFSVCALSPWLHVYKRGLCRDFVEARFEHLANCWAWLTVDNTFRSSDSMLWQNTCYNLHIASAYLDRFTLTFRAFSILLSKATDKKYFCRQQYIANGT